MWCPKCGEEKTRTVKTINCGHYMLRLRFCENCEIIYKTVEGMLLRKEQKKIAETDWLAVAEEMGGRDIWQTKQN